MTINPQAPPRMKTRAIQEHEPAETRVEVTLDDGSKWYTKTRSEPWRLGDGTLVVSLKGKAAGYLASRVRPIESDKAPLASAFYTRTDEQEQP